MQLVYMKRDGNIAEVDKDFTKTYENFLAHGWKIGEEEISADTSEPIEDAAPTETVELVNETQTATRKPSGRPRKS